MVGLRAVVMLRYVYCCSQEVAGFKYESDEKKSLDVKGMLLADNRHEKLGLFSATYGSGSELAHDNGFPTNQTK